MMTIRVDPHRECARIQMACIETDAQYIGKEWPRQTCRERCQGLCARQDQSEASKLANTMIRGTIRRRRHGPDEEEDQAE